MTVSRLLNRLLGLEKAKQNHLFELFLALFEEKIREDKRNGDFDEGILPLSGKVTATSFNECTSQLINRDAAGNEAFLYDVQIDNGTSWAEAKEIIKTTKTILLDLFLVHLCAVLRIINGLQ